MRMGLAAVFVLFLMLMAVADVPLVTVNVAIVTNAVNDAMVAPKKPVVNPAEQAERITAARRRSSAVVRKLIEEMKSIPGKTYLCGRIEVTVEQWHSVMKPDVPFVGDADLPVSGVSWNDCQDFIKILNERDETAAARLVFRLPTVKEWRHVCLAGAKGKWGRASEQTACGLDTMGWHAGNSGSRKSAVAQKTPNLWGLYDMHGNVFEWCSDTSPEYGGDFRLRVGGSFRSPPENCSAWFSNSANRQFSRYDDQGFRLFAERR